MVKLVVYVMLIGVVLYVMSIAGKGRGLSFPSPQQEGGASSSKKRFKAKRNPRETWMQVYETATLEEARALQARLQEQEVECVLYEQGKKDIHGNELKGVGIAVPKSVGSLAQSIISRMSG